MRVNVYEEELTDEVKLVSTLAATGERFYGVRFFLKSSPALHNTENDDDRSAVTFWCGSEEDCKKLFARTHHVLSHL